MRSEAGALLVLGGTGFIGGAVVRELLRPGSGGAPPPELRVLARRPLPDWMTSAGARRIPADLTDPDGLRGVCEGVGTVLHLASYVGRDPALCTAVNDLGTRAVAREADAAGARVLYVSTASVYGGGPHRGVTEEQLVPAPVSAASASRLRAEETVLTRGGVVLRPHLVHGPGDKWFVPLLYRLLRKVPVWPEAGGSRSSLVAVRDLARVVAALSRSDWAADRGTVYHVNHPRPVTLRAMVTQVCRGLDVPLPGSDLPRAAHRELAARVLPGLSAHQHALLTEDHWYESSRIWRRLGIEPGPGFAAGLVAGLPWYRRHVAGLHLV
ncbi:NAD-dependent epimerase/dehydratase family protein [Streptomyces albidochromogenes]|uniref:NAD-dependent epimerase/dehydratase family protein n=1 Tax=Streptomyces albidochromogenes TaxID=329524 RepID=A0ABW6FZL9_9ACTN